MNVSANVFELASPLRNQNKNSVFTQFLLIDASK